MSAGLDSFLPICLEGLLYGEISDLFFYIPCTFPKQVELFPGLGFYSGILAMYLQCQPNKSTGRTKNIVFYAICLLYLLSTVNFVSDLVALVFSVSHGNSIRSKNIIYLWVVQWRINEPIFSIGIVQGVTSGCCDFLAQCILVRINHCTYHPFY